MSIFKSKRHKETSPTAEPPEPAPEDRELIYTPLIRPFGDGLIHLPPSLEPPKFGDEQYPTAVAAMIEANAPRRFAVVAHDKQNHNSAVLAWGLDYGDNDIYVDSARDNTRWHVAKPEDIFKYFPEPPEPDCLEILWIDRRGGLVYWHEGTGAVVRGITNFLGYSTHADELIRAAIDAVRVADSESRRITTGSSNPNPYAASDSYRSAEHALADAGAHLAKANYHARYYRDSI